MLFGVKVLCWGFLSVVCVMVLVVNALCVLFLQLGHCCYGVALGFRFHNGDCLCALLVLGAVD